MDRQFNEFKAAELYCPKCQISQPVRERAAGSSLELLCFRCSTVVGRHTTVETTLGGKLASAVSRLLGRGR